jgi:hypothetical protein
MDRSSAARILGVGLGASQVEVDAAFRARARERHPDLVPTGSPEWEAAPRAMQALNDARETLSGSGSAATSTSTPGPVEATVPSWSTSATGPPTVPWSRQTVGPPDLVPAYRRERLRGYVWGAFLIVAAIISYLIGAASTSNDALPVWSPALAVIGLISLGLGWRADRRLRERRREESPGPR